MDTKTLLSLGIGLVVQAAGIVWWASKLQSDVQHNDFQIQMIAKDVGENSEFVKLWPAGKWGSGSLPSDVRQDLKIGMLCNCNVRASHLWLIESKAFFTSSHVQERFFFLSFASSSVVLSSIKLSMHPIEFVVHPLWSICMYWYITWCSLS